MIRDLSKLADRNFDLLIVGGGIVGAGIAWDAALRGLSCVLVEQGDFASGTSSKTTKLIHGGIRYLENLDFSLVRQSIQERQLLLKLVPHLVKPIPFLIPVTGNSPRPWPLVMLGVILYDLLAGRAAIQRHRILSYGQVQQEEPLFLETPVDRGAIYTDAQMNDARLVLEVLQTASQAGAVVVNSVKVDRWILENRRVVGAELTDRLSDGRIEVRAARIINATGPWVDALRRLNDPSAHPIVRPSKGIHLVYPDLGLRHALLLSSTRDRRIFFLIPWNQLTLIGTTDTDYDGDPGSAQADRADVDYLIEETNRILPRLKLEKSKVIATFAGIRPLVRYQVPFLKRYLVPVRKDPWVVSRAHLLHEDSNGLVSVVGGKFTTFRRIAEEVVDRVVRQFPEKRLSSCRTDQEPLRSQAIRSQTISRWIQADRRLADPICPHHPFSRAEIRYAVEQEMALSLSDLFWRRLPIGWSVCQGLDAIGTASQIMGQILGWSDEERSRQISRYQEEVAASRCRV